MYYACLSLIYFSQIITPALRIKKNRRRFFLLAERVTPPLAGLLFVVPQNGNKQGRFVPQIGIAVCPREAGTNRENSRSPFGDNGFSYTKRREWDSNSRSPCGDNSFQDCPFKPLRHPSALCRIVPVLFERSEITKRNPAHGAVCSSIKDWDKQGTIPSL